MNEDHLKLMKQMQEAKDLDQIANLFYNIVTMYGLTMAEVAALNYYLTQRTIKADHNARFIKDNLKLDVNTLGVDGIFSVQKALVNVHVDNVRRQH